MTTTTMMETFDGQQVEVVILGNQRFVAASQVGRALGFQDPVRAMSKLFTRNQREFESDMTFLVEIDGAGGRQLTRVYSARGAALIAMKAQTPKGEAFRRWVLDVLEGKAEAGEDVPVQAGELTPTVLYRLRVQFMEYPKMRALIRYRTAGLGRKEIAKLLEVSGSYVAGQLRVAEFLGLIERDPRIDRWRASPQFEAFMKGKAEYAARRRARLSDTKALPAPAASEGAEVNHG